MERHRARRRRLLGRRRAAAGARPRPASGRATRCSCPRSPPSPTASAVCAAGAVPIPVDVDPATAPRPGRDGARPGRERTRAAIVVHLYGRPAEPPPTRTSPSSRTRPRRTARSLPGSRQRGRRLLLLPHEEPGRHRRRRRARDRRRRARGPRPPPAGARHGRGQYVHDDRLAELPDVGARGGVAAARRWPAWPTATSTHAARSPPRYRSIDAAAALADRPPSPRPPPVRPADRRSGARREHGWRATASQPRSTTRGASPSSRPTRASAAARAPRPRRGRPTCVTRPLLPRADRRRGRPRGGGAHPAGRGRLTVPHPPAGAPPIVTERDGVLPLLQRRPDHRRHGRGRRPALRRSVDDFEIIVVDDGSQDGSRGCWPSSRSDPGAARRHPRVQPRLRRRAHQRLRGRDEGVDLLHRRRRPVRRLATSTT